MQRGEVLAYTKPVIDLFINRSSLAIQSGLSSTGVTAAISAEAVLTWSISLAG